MVRASIPQLNEQQLEAIRHGKGPLLIIAGAGTGKTTVVTERIKHLVAEGIAKPSEILALTFTEKAAREMQERVDIALPLGYTEMWIMTFHSFCDRVLKEQALHIGLDPHFRLMNEAESIRMFRKNLFEFELNYFRPLGNPHKFISGILQHFSRLKDEDIEPAEYLKWAKSEARNSKSETQKLEAEKWLELAKAYAKHEDLKAEFSVADYADLISNTLKLFRKRPNVLKTYCSKFKYVLVDEFQDTNIAQNELVKMLVQKNGNITVVADDDQAIYKWRGAAISNVLQFRKSYPTYKIVALTQNYRSSQSILDHAYKLIQNNNPDRLEISEKINKRLVASNKKKGFAPEFIYTSRVEDEAQSVVEKIIDLHNGENRPFSDFAILVRANNHSEAFVRALERSGVPFQFLGPGQLFKQPEIKELIAYLKVLYRLDDSACFYKVLTMDLWDIKARDLAAITNYAKRFNLTLFETAEKIDDVFISDETREKVKKVVDLIHSHLKRLPKETAGQILYYFLQESGLLQRLAAAVTPEGQKQAENISKFFDKLKTFEVDNEDASVFAVVDWIDLAMELGESPLAADSDWAEENAVNILTVHSSKGLEFPVIFIVNLVAQRFPTSERHEQIPIPDKLIKEVLPTGDHHLQEERRLFYVALTRARERAYLTAANYYGEGKREKKLSPFIFETLGEDVLPKTSDPILKKSQQLSILDFQPILTRAQEEAKQEIINRVARDPLTYLSYSQLETFRFCPLHYKMRYILKIPTPASPALSFGNTLHLTLKEFNQLIIEGRPATKKELLNIYSKVWIREGYDGREHEEQMKTRGLGYLETYLASELYDIKNAPLTLEQPFMFSINEFKVGGKIDRVNKTREGIEIIDYKTTDFSSKDLPTSKDLQKDLQMSVYALAAAKVDDQIFRKNPEQVTLSLYFLDKGAKVSTTRTAGEMRKAIDDIVAAKKEIEASDFECSHVFWCKNCEYKMFCEVNS